jgi:Bacterial transglutaminase-like N-terminal region
MKLHVGSDIVVRAEADCPIVAMLRPASGLAQWLSSETYAFEPWAPTTEYVDSFGNLCQRMVVPRGDMRLRVKATVETEALLATSSARHFRLCRTCLIRHCSISCRAGIARPTG